MSPSIQIVLQFPDCFIIIILQFGAIIGLNKEGKLQLGELEFKQVVREGPKEKVAFEQRLKESMDMSHVDIWGKSTQAEGTVSAKTRRRAASMLDGP